MKMSFVNEKQENKENLSVFNIFGMDARNYLGTKGNRAAFCGVFVKLET